LINRRKRRRLVVIIFIASALYILSMKIPYLLKAIYPIKYENIINRNADEYKLDPYLVAAIIKVESRYDSFAKSNKGALGLMQIKLSTGKWIGEKLGIKGLDEEVLYDPEINIKMGCWYLNYLLKYYNGDLQLALVAYNGGQGNVSKWLKDSNFSDNGVTLKVIPFEETRLYVEKVGKTYKIYNKIYKSSN